MKFWPRWNPEQYTLVDIGEGRRLERFAGVLVDRPCPAAKGQKSPRREWGAADVIFCRSVDPPCGGLIGRWAFHRDVSSGWTIAWDGILLGLKCTPSGQVGIFPEHAAVWTLLREFLGTYGPGLRILHLFGYTGAATLVAAQMGAEVFHVDAARSVVRWARENALRSGLAEAPIHWLCEDARHFVQREVRRGRNYHGVILDPPTYGHGPRGEQWHIARDLGPLLQGCDQLLQAEGRFLLLTAHASGYRPNRLARLAREAMPILACGELRCGDLVIGSLTGKELPAGIFLIWQRGISSKATRDSRAT